ncbi:hypothetical protein J4474_04310 [Candidatus Pacearchaeota archaeon]|nr:hypothetical protein [Candidatus Pacearchaeota archaeon]
MVSYTEKQVAMVSAVSEVLRLRKTMGAMTPEEMMRDLTKFLRYTDKEELKVLMVAAASKALSLITKTPGLRDKEVMGMIVQEMPDMISDVEANLR